MYVLTVLRMRRAAFVSGSCETVSENTCHTDETSRLKFEACLPRILSHLFALASKLSMGFEINHY